jgi:3-hydroxyisobutyrate dehydrogenase-like beta-hydroxyacid dehydrogenase
MSEKQTIAILGSGNIGLSLARGLVKAGIYRPDQIILTRRNVSALLSLAEDGFQTTSNNSDAVKNADIVVLAVLPQQLNKLLYEIKKNEALAYFSSFGSNLSRYTCTIRNPGSGGACHAEYCYRYWPINDLYCYR